MCGTNFELSMTSGTNLIGGTSGKKKDENKKSVDCKRLHLRKKAELMAQAHVASEN